jgi:hypothetical protein
VHRRDENARRISVRKAAGKRLLGKPNCRWEGNVKNKHKNNLWGFWTEFTALYSSFVNRVMHLQATADWLNDHKLLNKRPAPWT